MDDMRVGDNFNFNGQAYECVDWFEHEIPARLVLIYELHTKCPDCGTAFWTTASMRQIKIRNVRRRCDTCVKPGVRVNKKSPKRK